MTAFTQLNLLKNYTSPLILVRFYDIIWCTNDAKNPSQVYYLFHDQLCYDDELNSLIIMTGSFEDGANFLEARYNCDVEDYKFSIDQIPII